MMMMMIRPPPHHRKRRVRQNRFVFSTYLFVSSTVAKHYMERPWLNAQQIDTYGTCFPRGTPLDLGWCRPCVGYVKCNVNADWRNPEAMSGVSWIARDCWGRVLYHAREAFTKSRNRIVAELRCILWAVQSLRDLHVGRMIISSDCQAAIAALDKPWRWPQYWELLDAIRRTVVESLSIESITYEVVSCHSNTIARDIAYSVVKDGRYHSYLASDGPSWLSHRIRSEAQPRYVFRFIPYR
ncbi:PREDICTED: uncharacterized protein LOC109131164 [Camelina sativa]|uniref:Uncharacterized protein LOC109131164 n=1 Tax=Camelina sativa TaxID=90675 RepID=A0ABM1REE2_CAMSA|nr:PREDICTED: uncharacterized protein LOC109131164 [Camelina sativa]